MIPWGRMAAVETVEAATAEATAEVLEWAEAGWAAAARVVAREAVARAVDSVAQTAAKSDILWRIR